MSSEHQSSSLAEDVAGGTFAMPSSSPTASSVGARTRSGTPYCITVDPESLEDGAATIRDRDTMTQEPVALDLVPCRIADLVASRATWDGLPREAASA